NHSFRVDEYPLTSKNSSNLCRKSAYTSQVGLVKPILSVMVPSCNPSLISYPWMPIFTESTLFTPLTVRIFDSNALKPEDNPAPSRRFLQRYRRLPRLRPRRSHRRPVD